MRVKSGRRARCVLAAGWLAVSLVATGADAAPADARIWAKAGATQADANAALTACNAEAGMAKANVLETGWFINNGGGNQGGAIFRALAGNKIDQAFVSGPFRTAATRRCMARHGYAHLRLTEAEAAALKQGAAGTDRVLSGEDIGGRVAAALAAHPAPPEEPAANPFPFSALNVEPGSVVVTTGEVGAHELLLTGRMHHAQTGRLAADFTLHDVVTLTLPAGSVFYRTETATAESMRESVLCGPASIGSVFGGRAVTICAWADDDGAALMLSETGQPWMTGKFNTLGALFRGPTTGELRFTPSTEDLIGPMELNLAVDEVSKDEVKLAAIAGRNGKTVVFWSGSTPWDPDGHAVVPIAGGKLTLTRAKSTLRATFAAGPG